MSALRRLFPEYNVVNPFIYENELIEKFGGVEYYDKYKKEGLSEGFKEHAKAIVDNDLGMVERSDLVVAFVENKRQIGTLYEIAYAIEHNISVIVVCEQPSPFFVTLVEWYPTLEALQKKRKEDLL
jgi:nucleoside 2-deoxyribosyltransferase